MASYVSALTSTIYSYLPAIPFLSPSSTRPIRIPGGDEEARSTIFDPETCTRKGLHWVGGEGEPSSHEIYYELHGTGPERVLFVMGLNNTSFSWNKQVDFFGSQSKYSVLVFDNRGAGHSGTPVGPYSTSAMAQDALSLMRFVGWTETRSVHLVGISLGGMISLELASYAPELFASLTLCVTSSGHGVYHNLPPMTGLKTLTRLLHVSSPHDRISLAIDMLFPLDWLARKDEDDPEGRTHRETRTVEYLRRYHLARRQLLLGNLSQSAAALTHHVSPERLVEIERRIPKICILVGDEDNLVAVDNSIFLSNVMPSAEFIQWKETGHAIHSQHPKQFNDLVARVWREGRAKSGEPDWQVLNGGGDGFELDVSR